jgi:hypothetical protein
MMGDNAADAIFLDGTQDLPVSRSAARPSAPGKKIKLTAPVTALDTPASTNVISSDTEPEVSPVPNKDTIKAYYTLLGTKGKSITYKCKHCRKEVKSFSTTNSNLHTHQSRCPKLRTAFNAGALGISAKNRIALQTTITVIDPATGRLVQPFSQEGLYKLLQEWIIAQGLPFDSTESDHLRALLKYCNPAAQLPCAGTIRTRITRTYQTCASCIDEKLRNIKSVIHYAHDAWTDNERCNSFFGIIVSYVDNAYQYRQHLLRFMHLKGVHSGVRIGNGLFELFRTAGIATRVGPGTGDNASNNRTTAQQLSDRLMDEVNHDINPDHFVGCMCHIVNLAAQAFLKAEGERRSLTSIAPFANIRRSVTVMLEHEDYPERDGVSIPSIRIIGESALWSQNGDQTRAEVDDALEDDAPLSRLPGDDGPATYAEDPQFVQVSRGSYSAAAIIPNELPFVDRRLLSQRHLPCLDGAQAWRLRTLESASAGRV